MPGIPAACPHPLRVDEASNPPLRGLYLVLNRAMPVMGSGVEAFRVPSELCCTYQHASEVSEYRAFG